MYCSDVLSVFILWSIISDFSFYFLFIYICISFVTWLHLLMGDGNQKYIKRSCMSITENLILIEIMPWKNSCTQKFDVFFSTFLVYIKVAGIDYVRDDVVYYAFKKCCFYLRVMLEVLRFKSKVSSLCGDFKKQKVVVMSVFAEHRSWNMDR